MNVVSAPPTARQKGMVWTYTMLNTYREICPYQANERYIAKRVPFQETPAMRRGNEVHSALERRIGEGVPLPSDMPYESFATVFDGKGARVEQRLGITREGRNCEFFANDVWGRGKVDLSVVRDDTALLIDHKTGKVREDPFELEVQAVLLHARYPHLRTIKGHFLWLADGKLGIEHDVSDTNCTWREINRLAAAIEHDRATGQFEKRSGPLCRYCPCRACEFNRLEP